MHVLLIDDDLDLGPALQRAMQSVEQQDPAGKATDASAGGPPKEK